MYIDAIQAGKHLLAEKPFGIDLRANQAILAACAGSSGGAGALLLRISVLPGRLPHRGVDARQGALARSSRSRPAFWHSSDLDPRKPINWKRMIATCGEYGCMGDLGMHVVHLPFRAGWFPANVRALLSKIVEERPDKDGKLVPCETWDNAILACEVSAGGQRFPMTLSTKRIAPGNANTWFIRIYGTRLFGRIQHQEPQAAGLPALYPGGSPGMARAGYTLPVCLSGDHRADLRVWLFGRDLADVGRLLRRTGPRPRGHEPAVLSAPPRQKRR